MLNARTTRMLLVTLAACSLVLAIQPVARAHHRPNAYCSPSGDICQSAREVNGVRKLQITLAARYFSRYQLCVVAPDDSRTCRTLEIERQGEFYGDSVRWAARFPDEDRGGYTVIWKFTSGDRIGRKLGFHRT
jgi:hypothetical protein